MQIAFNNFVICYELLIVWKNVPNSINKTSEQYRNSKWADTQNRKWKEKEDKFSELSFVRRSTNNSMTQNSLRQEKDLRPSFISTRKIVVEIVKTAVQIYDHWTSTLVKADLH